MTYHLHESCKPPIRKFTAGPFHIIGVYWGYFDVEMTVEWQDKLDPSLSDTSFLTKPEATEDSQIKKEYAANRIQHVFHRYMTQKGRLEEAMLMMQASHSLITTVSRRKLR